MTDDQNLPTEMIRARQYEDRWAFKEGQAGILNISDIPSVRELQTIELFKDIEVHVLEHCVQDISIATWEAGAVLFEEGTYIDIAFYIESGEVAIHTSVGHQGARLGSPIFDPSVIQAMPAETRNDAPITTVLQNTLTLAAQQARQAGGVSFLASFDLDLPDGRAMQLGPGQMFGEIGALNGWPQSVTARTSTRCRLVQMRVPAVQTLRDEAPAFKARIDGIYRERTLLVHLRTLPLLAGCDDAKIAALAQRVDLVSLRPGEVLVKEGTPAEGFFLVRSGAIKLSQRLADGQIAVSYLSKGMVLGDVEHLLLENKNWFVTATSVGYSELVKMNSKEVAELLAEPGVKKQVWETAVARLKEAGYARRHVEYADLLEFSLQKGLVQGSSIMLIDLDRCTRCDDCVRACAETHEGRPRFVREGDRYSNQLVARACYHCRDPVCLIGCPTGAIHRAQVGDVVEIQEDICIGCGTCSRNCPYDAIIMQPTGTTWPEHATTKHLRGKDRRVASKCDLCHNSETGPACVSSCPQGCLTRVGTMIDLEALLRPKSEPEA